MGAAADTTALCASVPPKARRSVPPARKKRKQEAATRFLLGFLRAFQGAIHTWVYTTLKYCQLFAQKKDVEPYLQTEI